MRLKNVYDAVDALAPFSLSAEYCETYHFYDNSGTLLDCGGEVRGVLCSLDLSLRAVEAAKRANANVIFTHHPAIYSPVSRLADGEPLTECAKAGISVISAHLNLDSARGGIDEELMFGLGGSAGKMLHPLSEGGYGHVFSVREEALASFTERLKARGRGLHEFVRLRILFLLFAGRDVLLDLAQLGVYLLILQKFIQNGHSLLLFPRCGIITGARR